MTDLQQKLQEIIANHKIVLFMKGTKEEPLCGFSQGAVNILKKYNVAFDCINILASEDLRAAVKVFSNWPTYPQLYIKGEFIGGYDIMNDMDQNGELLNLLKSVTS